MQISYPIISTCTGSKATFHRIPLWLLTQYGEYTFTVSELTVSRLLTQNWCFFSFLFFFVFVFSGPPMAYGGSQARGWIGDRAASLHLSSQQHGIQATSATYTTAQGNAGSLICWVRPGIESASSWILVRLVSTLPQQELSRFFFFFFF